MIGEAPDMKVVGQACCGEEALYFSQKLNPDVILIDTGLQAMCSVTVTRLITQHHANVTVIGINLFAQDRDHIEAMLAAGAQGHLLDDVTPSGLIEAIRRAHRGEYVLPEESYKLATRGDDGEIIRIHDHRVSGTLGGQQKKVLALLTKGLTNPEIARQLDISVSAVRYHVSTILRKLEVSNRSEAVGMAVRLNIVGSNDF